MMKSVQVHDFHILNDKRRVIVRLDSFDWPSTIGLLIDVQQGDQRISARQTGFGNVQGLPTIELAFDEDWERTRRTLRTFLESGETTLLVQKERG